MYIKPFKDISKNDANIAGGKGASLGEMTQAGIPVPVGYVITSETFNKFLEITDINIEIDSILSKVDTEAVHTAEKASEEIQRLILSYEIPEDIKEEILSSFKELNVEFVAVRSSATAEDSATAAWAGQLDSYLNTTEETLLENVKECWASLFTPRAIFYRFEQKLDKEAISVAVVVQKMVNSEVSGIAFSVHPVTEDRNQIIIEAGLGLGEAIVSGQITPDSYVITKEPREILDKNVITQERGMFRKTGGGNEWKDVSKEEGEKQVLSDIQIEELTKIIITIENHYNFPVDIEWVFENNKFYIVQSRPITTLSGDGESGKTTEVVETMLITRYLQHLKGLELFPAMFNSSLLVQVSGWNTERYSTKYYSDKTSFPLFVMMKEDEGIMYMPITKIKKVSDEMFIKYWDRTAVLEDRSQEFRKFADIVDSFYEQLTYQHIDSVPIADSLASVEKMKNAVWELNSLSFFSIYFDKKGGLELLKKVNSNILLKRFNELWEIATVPISDSFEKRHLLYILNLFDQATAWDDIVEKCQYFEAAYHKITDFDETSTILRKKYELYDDSENRNKILAEEKELKIEKQKKYDEWFKVLNNEEKKLVKYIQYIIDLRDIRKDYLTKTLTGVFRVAQKMFKEAGISEKYILYYTVDEMMMGQKYLVNHINDLKKREHGFSVMVSDTGETNVEYGNFEENKKKMGDYFLQQEGNERTKDAIKGQVGSPGKVSGRVKIIKNINSEGGSFKEGSILVTGMTRPEFVPLMKKAKAIITDEGGITSHAAIVSRELGIPCVIGTKIATQVLKDGDMVEIDADNGIVRILEK